MKKALYILLFFQFSIFNFQLIFAQGDIHELRSGNRYYQRGKFDTAATHYRRILDVDSNDFAGQYNLGNALYRQGNYLEAANRYSKALTNRNLDDRQRVNTMHNMGNSFFKLAQSDNDQQTLKTAIECYKGALKVDPKNNDSRYNLAMAQRLLKKMQQQQQ